MNCRITRTIEALNATCARGFLPRACPFERRHPPSLPETSRFRRPRATYPFEADQRREESGGFVPPFADPVPFKKLGGKPLFFSLSCVFFVSIFFFAFSFFSIPAFLFLTEKKKKKRLNPKPVRKRSGRRPFFFFFFSGIKSRAQKRGF